MNLTKFTTTNNLNSFRFQESLNADLQHPHIHLADMPFRVTSTWQDRDCEFGVWEKENQILAWAVFQPPWRNLDYAISPSERGSNLEKEVFAWGKGQMTAYSKRTGEDYYGAIEFFENTPNVEQTVEHLEALGFKKHAESTFRFEIDLHQEFPQHQLPNGYIVCPSRGKTEVDDYVNLIQAVFGSDWMTKEWRMRTLEHPAYRPDIDLVIANSENIPVGFCLCWLWQDIGQIEPLGVHPDYQGKGLGKALELAAFEALQNQGARFMYVDHGSLNEKAIALSITTGFRQRNNALRYYVNTPL
jgi:ribosomal protein S18 acetylase RimI-like enzyme